MICASRPNFYKANSSLSEIFLHVSLNDLWLPSQFLQHNLIIKWNTPHMLRSMICGSRLNPFHQNMIIKWAALVWLLGWCWSLIRRTDFRDQDQQCKVQPLREARFWPGWSHSTSKLFKCGSETYCSLLILVYFLALSPCPPRFFADRGGLFEKAFRAKIHLKFTFGARPHPVLRGTAEPSMPNAHTWIPTCCQAGPDRFEAHKPSD